MKKLLVSLLATLSWTSAFAVAPQPADVAATRPDYFQFAHMHEMHLDRARVAPVDLLFLGDSITEAWWNVPDFWRERYGAHQPANFGISGDRTQHVIWRLEHGALDHISPRVVVLMIGTNNTADNNAAEILAGIDRILGLIREKRPETKVLLLGIFPRGPRTSWDGKPDPRKQRMAVIREVNAQLPQRADGKLIRFLDIGRVFSMRRERFPTS
jgi:lysophospholipase L1-like esterase